MNSSTLFGKLSPYNTFIHRMDARLKMFIMVVLMVLCFLPYATWDHNYYSNQFFILGIIGIIIIILMALAKVNFFSFLKSLNAVWFTALFLLIIMVFIPRAKSSTEILYTLYDFGNGYIIYWNGVLQTCQVIFRIVLMIGLTMVLTSTTAPMDITYAFEWYLAPLKLVHFPTQIISMILSLAIRMIPTILEESQRIMKAQKSRGVDFNRGFITAKIRSISTLIVPLLVSCFSRSEELSLAMYSRGYDPYSKRSKYKNLKFHLIDLIFTLISLLVLGTFIYLCIYSQNSNGFMETWFNAKGAW